MSKATLPDKIYLVDPFDNNGQIVENTEDVCWCADPAGDVNVGYIAEAAVAVALEELRAEIAHLPVSDFSIDLVRLDAVLSELSATIAALGLGGTEEA